jgi:hypothetical protein
MNGEFHHGPSAPCVVCGGIVMMRDSNGVARHKKCAVTL